MVPSLTNAAPVAGVPQPSTLNVAPAGTVTVPVLPRVPYPAKMVATGRVSDAVEATVPVTTN